MDSVTAREVISAEPVDAWPASSTSKRHPGEVPEPWHWLYLLERPTRDLGPDGQPTLGIPAPP